MNQGFTVERPFHVGTGLKSRKEVREGKETQVPTGRIPRVSRLMALAIRFDGLIRDGVVADQAELARLGQVSRARVSQIMNLLCLAPDIQEAILFLPPVESGRDPVTERELRVIVGEVDWGRQRGMWEGSEASPVLEPASCVVCRTWQAAIESAFVGCYAHKAVSLQQGSAADTNPRLWILYHWPTVGPFIVCADRTETDKPLHKTCPTVDRVLRTFVRRSVDRAG